MVFASNHLTQAKSLAFKPLGSTQVAVSGPMASKQLQGSNQLRSNFFVNPVKSLVLDVNKLHALNTLAQITPIVTVSNSASSKHLVVPTGDAAIITVQQVAQPSFFQTHITAPFKQFVAAFKSVFSFKTWANFLAVRTAEVQHALASTYNSTTRALNASPA